MHVDVVTHHAIRPRVRRRVELSRATTYSGPLSMKQVPVSAVTCLAANATHFSLLREFYSSVGAVVRLHRSLVYP